MTSLREEIKTEIQELNGAITKYVAVSVLVGESRNDLLPKDMNHYLNNIMSNIEKRIDSLKDKQLVPLLQYTLSSQEEKASMSYYHKALQDVKELLK